MLDNDWRIHRVVRYSSPPGGVGASPASLRVKDAGLLLLMCPGFASCTWQRMEVCHPLKEKPERRTGRSTLGSDPSNRRLQLVKPLTHVSVTTRNEVWFVYLVPYRWVISIFKEIFVHFTLMICLLL